MSTSELAKQSQVVQLINKDSVHKRFNTLLGERSQQFISSLLQVVRSSNLLLQAEPESVLNAAATAAVLNLPINQNLGFAWIVPYKPRNAQKSVAQFQMGWKGFVQLAQRTGQYKRINVVEVYENQFTSYNALSEELEADFTKDGEGKIVGYVGYFRLINGYEKTVYWSRRRVELHAKKYSQSYKRNQGVWADGEDGFTAMAKKTVLKLMLSQWGILSVEMEKAHIADQGVLDEEGNPIKYPDNQPLSQEEKNENEVTNRIIDFITKANSLDELEMVKDECPKWPYNDAVTKFYEAREKQLETKVEKKS